MANSTRPELCYLALQMSKRNQGATIPDNFNTNTTPHKIFQYVDDSTNIIATDDTNQLQSYINLYFSILEEFYNVNKLLINSDKSKLLIITKPNLRQFTNDITLQANKYLIQQSTKIKILGVFLNSGFNNIPTVNSIISKVN